MLAALSGCANLFLFLDLPVAHFLALYLAAPLPVATVSSDKIVYQCSNFTIRLLVLMC
jgi:hypothetical protein